MSAFGGYLQRTHVRPSHMGFASPLPCMQLEARLNAHRYEGGDARRKLDTHFRDEIGMQNGHKWPKIAHYRARNGPRAGPEKR